MLQLRRLQHCIASCLEPFVDEKIHASESVVRTQEKNCERSDVTRLHLLLLLVVVVVVPGYQDVVIVMLLFPGQGNRNINGQEMKKDMETETETDKK